ncbi:uncharacterized protein LOC109829178, partial [Asparagus officinalis]|uniref:uncharacterized protein LOC109829178 n=1 Tax=Asparagus officinalis TaxID=4686 RepID=UPI00098E56C0
PVTLVSSPSYPNSIAWSKENLVAVASGHLITILNPALPVRPRGLIRLPPSIPFRIGVVDEKERLTPCIMPLSLARDVSPCARSISWSPLGFAPNSGCLLAVCTTDGRVKVYRSPFCEFRPEWVEVLDVSEMLYCHLKRISFQNGFSATFAQEQVSAGCISERGPINSISAEVAEHRKTRGNKRIQVNDAGCLEELPNGGNVNYLDQNTDDELYVPPKKTRKVTTSRRAAINPCSSAKQVSSAKKFARQQSVRAENDTPELITAKQYTFRSMLLSSLTVAWSPAIKLPVGDHLNVNSFSILAVGGKAGNISFWRIDKPQCYTIEHGRVPVEPVFIGLLQAHNSWITAMSWGMHSINSSGNQLVLATGSCDGSVKIWLGHVERLMNSSEDDNPPLSLLRHVTEVTSIPVSTISLVVPLPSPDKFFLAIGRGSGSLEACIYQISSNKVDSMCLYNAHNQAVTGLAWAFGARCLYSCSQDNSVRSWALRESSLCEIPFPLSSPGLNNPINLSQVSDLCFGLALSPGELVVAVVRSFDSALLNQMYQARTQKAAVEFCWIGGHSFEPSRDQHLEGDKGTSSGLSERDLVCWESNILYSLKHYDNLDEPLVLWDILMALLPLQKYEPNFVQSILFKWMSSLFPDYQSIHSVEKILLHVQSMLPKMSTRRMQLFNILCRRLMRSESKLDIHEEMRDLNNLGGEGLDLWNKLLENSEKELQERFVAFSFKAVIRCAYRSTSVPAIDKSWCPVGVAQMERWVAINLALVCDELKLLASEVGDLRSRIRSICEYVEEETCSYCSALVPFESTRVATCKGIKHQDGTIESHELKRCSVSMQLGSINSPMWFCMCCERQAINLPPSSFFTMSESPLDVNYESVSFAAREFSVPLCLFCGILLQRDLPNFLLSASPV